MCDGLVGWRFRLCGGGDAVRGGHGIQVPGNVVQIRCFSVHYWFSFTTATNAFSLSQATAFL